MHTLNWRISKHISAITENKIIIPLAADTHDPTRTWKKRSDFPWTGSWVSARMLVLLLSKTQWNSDNVYQCYFLVASFILCNQSGRIPPCPLFPSVFADSRSQTGLGMSSAISRDCWSSDLTVRKSRWVQNPFGQVTYTMHNGSRYHFGVETFQ